MENEKDLETQVEASEESNEAIEEIDYDSDGNYTIPEDEEGEDDSSEEKTDDGDDAEEETSEKEPDKEEVEEAPEKNGGKDEDPEALRARISELERERRERDAGDEQFNALLMETLSKLGAKSADPKEALIELAAESRDISPADLKKELDREARTKKALELLDRTELEQTVREDLQTLKSNFPELSECKTIHDIPNVKEFAEFRDLGLTAIQAYSAANPDGIRKSVAASVKRQNLNDTKAHLRSSVSKSTKSASPNIPIGDLKLMRSAFPGKSDREIHDLYRKVTK